MWALFSAAGVVGVAEIGDKTQLLALALAARFRRPFTIWLGIVFASLANSLLAAGLGHWASTWLTGGFLHLLLAVSFLLAALWISRAHADDASLPLKTSYRHVFIITFVSFFVSELADKTQLATLSLAIRYNAFYTVALGATLGLAVVNGTTLLLGQKLADKIFASWLRIVAGIIFLLLAASEAYRAWLAFHPA